MVERRVPGSTAVLRRLDGFRSVRSHGKLLEIRTGGEVFRLSREMNPGVATLVVTHDDRLARRTIASSASLTGSPTNKPPKKRTSASSAATTGPRGQAPSPVTPFTPSSVKIQSGR
jgi:hypothetical protein